MLTTWRHIGRFLGMLPTQEELDAYVESVTEYVKSVSDSLYDLYGRLVSDIQRHGPWPVVSVPGLGSFEVPAPQPPLDPPPAPLPWYRLGFIEDAEIRHRVMIAGVAGVGLGIGWGTWTYIRHKNSKRKRKESLDKSKLRREVVGKPLLQLGATYAHCPLPFQVVLGGDTLAGPALVHSLEKRGYVVLVSVSGPDAVDQLEKKSKGNVKALVLNPKEVFFLYSEHITALTNIR
jgi:hypothetical protein